MHTIKGGCWLLSTNPPPPPDPPPCVSSCAAYVNFRVKLWWRHQFIRHFKIVLLALRINQLARCCVVSANIRRIFCPFSFVFAVCALSLTLSCICFLTQCGLWCQIGQLNLADTKLKCWIESWQTNLHVNCSMYDGLRTLQSIIAPPLQEGLFMSFSHHFTTRIPPSIPLPMTFLLPGYPVSYIFFEVEKAVLMWRIRSLPSISLCEMPNIWQ